PLHHHQGRDGSRGPLLVSRRGANAPLAVKGEAAESHASLSATTGWLGLCDVLSVPFLSPDRQDDAEARPPPGRALDLDVAAVVRHDAVADAQAQAGPLAQGP